MVCGDSTTAVAEVGAPAGASLESADSRIERARPVTRVASRLQRFYLAFFC
jgi:hypothetical protein